MQAEHARIRELPERILSAAIWLRTDDEIPHQPINVPYGIVFCGWRHCSIFPQIENYPDHHKFSMIQGFVTTKNRFVDRSEGGKIAFAAGQTTEQKSNLCSEDVW